MPVLSQIYHHVQPLSLPSIHSCVCVHCVLGGLQTDLPDLPEGWLFQFVEGKLGHHGSSHPVCCYPVLRPWAVQGAAGRLLWLSGQVSVRSLENHLQLDFIFQDWMSLCFGFPNWKCKIVPYLSTFVSFIFQSAATVAKVIGWVAGWRHGRHAYLSAGYGAGEDGCNAEGNVRLSRSN